MCGVSGGDGKQSYTKGCSNILACYSKNCGVCGVVLVFSGSREENQSDGKP